jgi:hypothetical protein
MIITTAGSFVMFHDLTATMTINNKADQILSQYMSLSESNCDYTAMIATTVNTRQLKKFLFLLMLWLYLLQQIYYKQFIADFI